VIAAFCSDAIAQSLNPTGRDIDLVTPLFQDGRLIGDVVLHITADDMLSVNAEGVIGLLGDRINDEAGSTIIAATGPDGRTALPVFENAGAPLIYDPATLTLVYTPSAAALGERSLSLANDDARPEEFIEPARFAGYLNFAGGVQFESGDNDPDGFEVDDVDIDGALRAFDIVIEGAGRYEEDDLTFSRRFTRAVYDHLPTGNRLTFGDIRTPFSGLVDGAELFGFAIENTGALRPFDNLRPRGRTQFEIERTSTVAIFSNGTLIQRSRLEPGIFDLNDIPLAVGANRISVIVEDDQGREEIANFNQFFDSALLARGKTLYSAALGVVSETSFDEPEYDFDRPALSAQIEHGLTDEITVGGAARLTREQGIAGVSAAAATPIGTIAADAAGSYSDLSDVGAGASLSWLYFFDDDAQGTNIRRRPSLFAILGARTESFIDIDPFDLSDQTNEFIVDLSLDYTQPLTETLLFGANAFFGKANDTEIASDRYSIGASLGGVIGDRYSWSVQADFIEDDDDDDEGFRLGVTLGIRLGDNTGASGSYDTRDNRFSANLRHTKGRGVGAYSTSLSTSRSDLSDDINLSAAATYVGNRFEATAAHREVFSPSTSDRASETEFRIDSAIAFADGHVGIGRPISGAFVLAASHRTLEDRSVILNQRRGSFEAKSGPLGPAVVSGFSAYRPARVTTDVEDLPIGYGYFVEVGSDAQITLTGTLLDENGEPIGLATGIARNIDDPDDPPRQVFTARGGRFALQGIKAGIYEIALTGGGVVRIETPSDAVGLVRVGKITVNRITVK